MMEPVDSARLREKALHENYTKWCQVNVLVRVIRGPSSVRVEMSHYKLNGIFGEDSVSTIMLSLYHACCGARGHGSLKSKQIKVITDT